MVEGGGGIELPNLFHGNYLHFCAIYSQILFRDFVYSAPKKLVN